MRGGSMFGVMGHIELAQKIDVARPISRKLKIPAVDYFINHGDMERTKGPYSSYGLKP